MACEESLESLLGDVKLDSVLVIGVFSVGVEKTLIDRYITDHSTCVVEYIDVVDTSERLIGLGRYDLVIVSRTIESMPRSDAIHLIARLRDIHSRRLVLFVPIGDDWPDSVSHWYKRDLLALGMVQMAEHKQGNNPIHIYGYDILTYKTRPDWLNSRFWANPNLFNKYWW